MRQTFDRDDLNSAIEFDSPFQVFDDGTIETRVSGIHAPNVEHDDQSDVLIESTDWEALTGFTGQYGYRGAVMHASEQFQGGIVDYVIERPGVYCLVVVEAYDDRCIVCAETADYCQGHGEIGDPEGYAAIQDNDGEQFEYRQSQTPAGWAVVHYTGERAE